MAPPGCPDFAFSTIDTARMRILSAAFYISLLLFFILGLLFKFYAKLPFLIEIKGMFNRFLGL